MEVDTRQPDNPKGGVYLLGCPTAKAKFPMEVSVHRLVNGEYQLVSDDAIFKLLGPGARVSWRFPMGIVGNYRVVSPAGQFHVDLKYG